MAEWDVPGYAELKALGSGGFGDVVLARHNVSGTLVAIKYLRRDLLADAVFSAMFRAEAEVLASLEDPNVVRLYEYVESPSGAAIVMELVDGVSLQQILADQGATTAEAALVVLQGSLLGLAAAHQRGVVHRDYKPENVLVDGRGVSKLTDFGIAARAGDRPVPAGTLMYAPPEQFAGTPVSPASDVYAATATFYECLVGRPPFSGDTAEALAYQHRSQPVPLDPVPEPLRPLVIAGMAKDPGDRPADGVSFVAALNAIASGTYGQDWEQRGRSHLGEAALLLSLLWPSSASPAVGGSATETISLSQNPGESQDSQESQHLRHLSHLQHLRHLLHLRRKGFRPIEVAVVAATAILVVTAATALAASFNRPGGSTHHRTEYVSLHSSAGSLSGSSRPAVTGISPASGSTAGGTKVTLTGTDLSGVTSVSFGGKPATITDDPATQITVVSPPGHGTVHITVTTPAGTVTALGIFTYTSSTPSRSSPPAVSGVFPASGSGVGGTSVSISGTGLYGATGVSFGGNAGTITADSATEITVTSPSGTGTVDITVTTSAGSSAATVADQFTYLGSSSPTPPKSPPSSPRSPTPPKSPPSSPSHPPSPPSSPSHPASPVVSEISPASGFTTGGTTVTITGTGLSGATGVSFGGAAAKIAADSATQVTVTSPSGSGTVEVTVTTSAGTSADTTAGQFTYVAPPPVVTGVSPNSGTTEGGTTVTITGTGLSGATGVSFGGNAGHITADSATQVTVTSPSGSGTVEVTVTTSAGTSADTTAGQFTYVAPPPVVTGISPATGYTTGGTMVTITGAGLADATGVSFADAAAKIIADSATQITVTSPSGEGKVNVTVTTPGGTSAITVADQFTYYDPID